jgi:hypothetical protein
VVSVGWFASASGIGRCEPAVQLLGLLGGLTGVLAQRRAAARERRSLALAALADELSRDAAILDDPRFTPRGDPHPRIYPRLPVSAVDVALTSAALGGRGDADLVRRLHAWRDDVTGFNRRLDLTEVLVFTARTPADLAEFERALCDPDSYLGEIRCHLRQLLDHLAATSGQPGPAGLATGEPVGDFCPPKQVSVVEEVVQYVRSRRSTEPAGGPAGEMGWDQVDDLRAVRAGDQPRTATRRLVAGAGGRVVGRGSMRRLVSTMGRPRPVARRP